MNYNEVVSLIKLIEDSKFNTCEINFENTYINLNKLDSHASKQAKEVLVEATKVNQIVSKNDVLEPVIKTEEINIEQPKETNTNEVSILSPIVGTFYESAKDGDKPFVSVGDTINEGDTLCIVEAMKVMNEVKSKHKGVIKKVLLNNADVVEFNQPLFIIEQK